MRRVFFDIESDDLLPRITKVHAIVVKDMDTGQIITCTDSAPSEFDYDPIRKALKVIGNADRIVGHNILGFDLLALKKIYPSFTYRGEVVDTQVVVQARWPHIKAMDFKEFRENRLPPQYIGRHTLEAWGYRLGVLKTGTNITDWSEWSPAVQSRCEQDINVTEALYEHIKKVGLPRETMEVEHHLRSYLAQQEENGWPFDLEAAQALVADLSDKREVIDHELRGMFDPWYARDGKEVVPKRSRTVRIRNKTPLAVPETYTAGAAYGKIKLVEFNPASRQHIARVLSREYGWEPTEFTATGLPKIDEEHLVGMDFPPVEALRKYLILDSRLGQIAEGKEAWIGHAKLNSITGLHHIHHRCKQCHAITGRASHASPNAAQVPRVVSPYGKACRALWGVPEGWVQLGCDVAGLELRTLAHYMYPWDSGAYCEAVLASKPDDVHTKNAAILSITRDDGKTFIYALIYGAGDIKLGVTIMPGEPESRSRSRGKRARSTFMGALPALDSLLRAVKEQFNLLGYVRLIDGRRAYPRAEHSALNTLIQGTGAMICKRWIVEFDRRLCEHFGTPTGGGWEHEWAALAWIHDEVQLAVRPEHVEVVGRILLESIRAMEDHYSFRLPLDGEVQTGKNWAEAH